MDKLIAWWGQGVFFSLCVSIVLLGTGRLESSLTTASAWSVSRTTFFFWLLWKLMIRFRRRRFPPDLNKLSVPVPLLVFFTFVTLSLLPDFQVAGDYRYFLFGSTHYLMIADLFNDAKRSRLLIFLLALLPGLIVVRGILYDPSVFQFGLERRFGYPLPHPNIAGYLFALSIPLALAVAVGEPRLRIPALLSCATQLLGLLLTYSRGSWLGWGASLFFFGVALKRWREIGLLAAAAALVLLLAPPLQDRFMSLAQPQSDKTIKQRIVAMTAGIKVGLDHPVLGVGYGRGRLRDGLRELYQDPATGKKYMAHTHNVYVELFAETGVLGLGAFLWLIVHGFCRALRNARRAESAKRVFLLGIASSWIAFAVTGLGDVPFFHHDIRIFFFTLLALIYRPGDGAPPTRASAGV